MRHVSAAAVLAIAAILSATPAPAQQSTDLGSQMPVDPAVTAGTLPNGLRYFIRENREPRDRAELRLVVSTGSVLEDDDQLGLAHFVEHMAFNGTEHFEKQQLVDYLERIGMRFGADLNAYTSFDETVYMLTVPTDSAELVTTAFQILEDWAHGQVFDHEEIDKERGVVIEEWRLGQGAAARMQDKQFPILFKNSRYAERIPIGNPEILESFDYDALVRFYREWYRPDLMAIVAVGDFDAAEIEEHIEQHFAHIRMPDNPRERPIYPVPDHEETLYAIATDEEATVSSVGVYWKQALRDDTTLGAYRQSIVESLYNQMLNTRLFELTQEADPPYLGAYSGQGRFIGAKEVYILAAGVADNGIERGLLTLLTEGERVAQFGFTESELEREKAELLRAMEQAYAEREKTNSSAYASEYVRAFLFAEPIPGIAYEFELYQRFVPEVRLEDVDRLAAQWIIDENRVIMVNGPQKEDVKIPDEAELSAVFAAVAAEQITPYVDSVSDAPLIPVMPEAGAIVETEAIEEIGLLRWELDNGVRVLLKPTDFKDDEILIRAWSQGGVSLASDEDYIAASTAVAAVTQGGAGAFSLVDLQKVLAGKAVRVSPFIAGLGEGFSGGVSPTDVETLFQLTYLYFTAPRRDEDAFQSYKTRLQAFLANRSSDPVAVYRDTLQVTMYQNSFRYRPPSVEVFNEMDLDKSFAFYRDRFADASDFTFVIVGAFDPDSIKPLVLTYLGGLPSIGRDETWRDNGARPPTGVVEKTVFAGIEPKSQTDIIFTGPFDYTRANRHAMLSLANVMRIRLREVLREDMGGTYGVGVSGSPSRDPYPNYSFHITFGTAPERLDELVDVVFQEIDSLKAVGPTQEDIDKVKEMQRRELETDLRENSYWLGQLSVYDRHGADPRDILTYDAVIESLTVEIVQEAARLYLDTGNFVRGSLFPEEASQEGQR
jgi:zinc protease